MRKILLILLVFCLFPKGNAQEFTNSNNKIINLIQIKLATIGKTIIKQVKNGKFPVYRYDHDSLILIDPSDINVDTSLKIEGFLIQFTGLSKPEETIQQIKLKAIAPMAHREFAGIQLSLGVLFYIELEDFQKFIPQNDLKFITILSNLLFSSNTPIVDSTRVNQDLTEYTKNTIIDKLGNFGYAVELTQRQLEPLNEIILDRICTHFENFRLKNLTNQKIGIFKDPLLKKEYTKWELDSALDIKYPMIINDPLDSNRKIKHFLSTPKTFTDFNSVIHYPNAIGISYQVDNLRVVAYLPKKTFFNLTEEWERFILQEIL